MVETGGTIRNHQKTALQARFSQSGRVVFVKLEGDLIALVTVESFFFLAACAKARRARAERTTNIVEKPVTVTPQNTYKIQTYLPQDMGKSSGYSEKRVEKDLKIG